MTFALNNLFGLSVETLATPNWLQHFKCLAYLDSSALDIFICLSHLAEC